MHDTRECPLFLLLFDAHRVLTSTLISMKIEEVPQDLKYYKNSLARDVDYAVDSQGRYQQVMSAGWTPKNDALEITLDDINQQCEEILEQIRAGQLSPLAYHAKHNLMDISLLATYTGFFKWRIRRHMKPKYFQRLTHKQLQRYADVLRISVEELLSIPQ